MLKAKAKENVKLKGLQSQILDMHSDFEDMKKTREEAKKHLEEKFMEVQKKMQVMKENIENEAKRVKEALQEFEFNYDTNLVKLHDHIYEDFNKEKEFTRVRFIDNVKEMY